MNREAMLSLAADVLLVLHASFVAFVVFGLLAVMAGGLVRWQWVRNPWFRVLHLAAIGIVVAQAWLGIICPLTTWEMRLRELAGDAAYSETFIAHWVHRLLYFDAPMWVFACAYTLLGLVVLGVWLFVRPRPFHRAGSRADPAAPRRTGTGEEP
jgi:hypothetical protein